MYYYSFIILILFYNLFFFNDTATTEIYTLSLHDALPISLRRPHASQKSRIDDCRRHRIGSGHWDDEDRKSTRLNSSHSQISYAVFCLKKKNKYIIKINLLLISIILINIVYSLNTQILERH